MIRPALLALATLLTIPAVHATVLYSTSFENPPFTTGAIAGQDGWSVFGPGISTVESSFALAGSQAVFVDGGTASQSGPFHSDSSVGPIIDLSADIAIFTSSTQSEWQFAAIGPGGVGFLGGIDVFPNNTIEAITSGSTPVGVFPRATAFDSTAWHHIDLLFNMPAQTYSIVLDGSTLASNVAFCGDNGPCAGGPVPTYGLGFFDSFGNATSGGTGGTNDSGFMDNFQVAAAATPEPSTMLGVIAGLAVLGVGLRRRLKASN